MGRELIWKDEKTFHGWGCNACGWVQQNPRISTKKDAGQETRVAFNDHDCAKNPKKASTGGSAH